MPSTPPSSRPSPPPWVPPTPCTPTPRPHARPATATSSHRRRWPCASRSSRERAYITDPEAGIDFSRVVHGEQRFVHHRPITAGDEVARRDDRRRGALRRRPRDGDHPHRAVHDGRRRPRDVDVDDRRPRRGGVSMAARPLSEVSVGDVVGPVTVPVSREHARRLRQRLLRPEPHPPGRGVRPLSRAARRHRPRHVDDGRLGHRRRRLGRGRRPGRGVRHPVHQAGRRARRPATRSSCEGVVKAVDAETGRVTVDLTTTCGGEKVLGRCVAVVRLD